MPITINTDKLYDTDLTDAAWALIGPMLPAARSGGRPRTTNVRAVLNAIFYLLRTGCQWRLLPREFPVGRNRRLSKDYEYSVQTSETLIDIAATRLILNRLASA